MTHNFMLDNPSDLDNRSIWIASLMLIIFISTAYGICEDMARRAAAGNDTRIFVTTTSGVIDRSTSNNTTNGTVAVPNIAPIQF